MLQEGENSYAAQVLGRLAQRYGFANDTEFGAHLGVTRQTISNWRTRDSLDYRLLLDKFPDADLNWLFRGAARQADPDNPKDVLKAIALISELGYRVTLEKAPTAAPAAPRPEGEGSPS
jgi:hypothetical protein